MSVNVLSAVSQAMNEAGLNYEFGVYNSEIPKTYWVGEYQELDPINEDGMHETSFILTGFTRDSRLELEKEKEKIQKMFPHCGGYKAIADDGSAVAIFYAGCLANVPTGDAELKKIEVNLTIKEWKVI